MDVISIEIDKLFISENCCRKNISNSEDMTSLLDLANNIKVNSLINPITVTPVNDKYEIVLGKRRYLAMKILEITFALCRIININKNKIEELSLIENIHFTKITTFDLINSYYNLYKICKCDIDLLASTINVDRFVILKYLRVHKLPISIKRMLDSENNKISIDVAVELTKLPVGTESEEIINTLLELSDYQKISVIKEFIKSKDHSIKKLDDIRCEVVLKSNNIIFTPMTPFVIDKDGNYVLIPCCLYSSVIDLINKKFT